MRRRVHFIGIGGVGMSGIAHILLRSGYDVSGSDLRENQETRSLASEGATIFVGHQASNIEKADTVVYSSAVSPQNPELMQARRQHLTILARGEMLAELMRKKKAIVVAGSHGKTTTTALCATLMMESGCDPTVVIGGRLRRIANNARMGSDEWFVSESDESDGSFLKTLPTVAVVTNIDHEHLSHYGSFQRLEEAFHHFVDQVPFDGLAVICAEDPAARQLSKKVSKPLMTYGIDADANLCAQNLQLSPKGANFDVLLSGKKIGSVQVPLMGRHNVLNALAAIGVGLHAGLSMEAVTKGLLAFEGIDRRMELKGEVRGIRVVDDYAHHPTEIRATLSALRVMSAGGKVRVMFQPHRYSRVHEHWDDFVSALSEPDELILSPLYAASEAAIEGVSSERLAHEISKQHRAVVSTVTSIEAGALAITRNAKKGDLLVTMGAGDITKAGAMIVSALRDAAGERQ